MKILVLTLATVCIKINNTTTITHIKRKSLSYIKTLNKQMNMEQYIQSSKSSTLSIDAT